MHSDRIVSDEPRSAAKPLGKEVKKTLPPTAIFDTPSRVSATPVATPSTPASTPVSRRLEGKSTTTGPRSKKARLAEKHETLQAYAEELFHDLNKTVFNGELPASTKLNWNKRLLKTAGRAKFHRWVGMLLIIFVRLIKSSSRHGVQTVEIELAPKILDCEGGIIFSFSCG
jgi:hypothetical protein